MKFTRIDVLIKMISRYRDYNYKNDEIVILAGLETLSELRKKARSWITRREDGSETFGGCNLFLRANNKSDYLAIAYYDGTGYLYLAEIE